MNSLDDLRATLDAHASDLDAEAGAGVGRAASVRGRVHVVRRRRRAAAAGASAAVLAAVGALTLLPTGSERAIAPATVVGVRVPTTMTALGFGYDLAEGIDGKDGKVSVELAASDSPRLVSWATSGADRGVVVRSAEAETPVPYRVDDFGDYVYVPAGSGGQVTVRADEGDPGLAIYTLGEARPEGYSKGGVTYRRSGAVGELAGAVVGEPGQVDVSFDAAAAPAGAEGVRFALFCVDGPADAFLELEVGGKAVSSLGTSCDGPLDPDGSAGVVTSFRIKPGRDLSARVYATDGYEGPLLQDDDLVLGVAAYTTDSYVTDVGSEESRALVVENGGHRWERIDTVRLGSVEGGERTVTSTVPDVDGPVLAIVQTRTSGPTAVEFGEGGTFVGSDRGNGRATGVVAPGEVISVTRRNGEFVPGDEKVVSYYVHAGR